MIPNDENTPAAAEDTGVPQAACGEQVESAAEDTTPDNIDDASHDAAFDDDRPDIEQKNDSGETEADASAEAKADDAPPSAVDPAELRAAVEAVLFVADGPITPTKISLVLGRPASQIREILVDIAREYETVGRGFRLEEIAGGWQMLSDPRFVDYVKALFRTAESGKITAAMLETLSIVAYKQPIIRADVEAIRGVQAGPMLRSLMEKGLVRIAGRAEIIGRPFLYGTTKKFLEHFGLRSLKDLPEIEELRPAPNGE